MAYSTCPGQDRRFWKPGDIYEEPCPECGAVIEFWKDDVKLQCGECSLEVMNPRFDPGCARWCPYAEECLGDMARSYLEEPEAVRDRLESSLRRALGMEPDRVDHALKTAELAGKIIQEEGGNALLVIGASLVHELSDEERREALSRASLDNEMIAGIEAILGESDSPERRVFADAHLLATGGKGDLVTEAGRALAAQIQVSTESGSD